MPNPSLITSKTNEKTLIQGLQYIATQVYYHLNATQNLFHILLEQRHWVKLNLEKSAFEEFCGKHWLSITRLIIENEYNDIKHKLEGLTSTNYDQEGYAKIAEKIEKLLPVLESPYLEGTPGQALHSVQVLLKEWLENKLQLKILENKLHQAIEATSEYELLKSRMEVLSCYVFDQQRLEKLLELIATSPKSKEKKSFMARHSQEFYELVEKYQSPQYRLFNNDVISQAKQMDKLFKEKNEKTVGEIEQRKNQQIRINSKEKILQSINVRDTEFSVSEQRAINALVVLIDRALNEDQLQFIAQANKAFLKVKTTDYYEAFGLTKIQKGKDAKYRYSGGDVEQAQLGLYELMAKWFMISIEERSVSKGKEITKTHSYVAPLISPASLEITKEQIVDLETSKSHVIVNGTINIFIDRVFFNGLDKKFFYVPRELNKEIRTALKGKRSPSPAIGHFVKYLHYLKGNAKSPKTEVSYLKLIEILHMKNYHNQGKRQRIKQRIEECFEVGQEMGLLKKVEEGINSYGFPKYILYLG